MAVFKGWVWFLLCIFASLTCNLRTEKMGGCSVKACFYLAKNCCYECSGVQSILHHFCFYLTHKGRMFNCCVMSKMHGKRGRLDWIPGVLPYRSVLLSSHKFIRSVSSRWRCNKKFTCRWKYKRHFIIPVSLYVLSLQRTLRNGKPGSCKLEESFHQCQAKERVDVHKETDQKVNTEEHVSQLE